MSWSILNLNDICRPKQWKTIAASQLVDNGYTVYGANGKIGFFSEYTHKNPTLMITCRGATCGNVHISEPESYINGNAMALDDMDESKVFIKYLYYFLAKRGFSDVISGSAQPQITRQGLQDIEIPLPPLPEQKRIAAILDKADSLRRKRQQAMQLADDFLRAVFLELFGDLFCDAGYQLAYKKQISELTTYIDYRGKTPEKSESGIPLITAKNVKKGYVSEEPREYIPESTYESRMTRGQPLENDVLFTTEAPLGNAALLGKYEKVSVGQRLVSLRSKGELTQEYLLFCLLNPFTQNLIDQKSSGSTVKGIRTKELYQIELPIPDINEQKKFSDIYTKIIGINKRTAFCDLSNNKLFESLSQKAFVGEL